MSLKSYLFILFIIFLASASSVGLLLFYMNPTTDPKMAIGLMGTGILLAGSSFLAGMIFFMKKVYYRGDVSMQTMNASLRQAIFVTIGGLIMVFFYNLGVHEPKLFLIVWAVLGCIEVMIQAVE